ncbi:hypothetical protein BKA65DRAFT_575513 [Rhexocercosporidium sp. MPI-PUGE-AT-0058]|nr:hypothetical protein BKA65DRAFT_575513 [Rhexocercosporidium sp. MPI-PUGE-AT-0058]
MDIEGHSKTVKGKGIPQTGVFKADKSSLYPERLHSIREAQSDEVNSFFVRRSVYFAFFGKPNRATCEKIERLIGEEQGRLTEQNRQEQEQWQARLAREEQQVRLEQERLEQERVEQEKQKLEQERLAKMEQTRKKKTEERGNQQPNPARSKDDKKQTTSSPSAVRKNRKRTTRIDFSKLVESVIQQPAESRGSASVPQLDRRTSRIQEDIGEQAIPQDLQAVAGDISTSTSNLKTPTQRPVDIHFKIRDYGKWRLLQTLSVDPSNTRTCFEDAIADGENTLYLIPKWELNNGNDSNGNGSNGNEGSNENDSEVPQSARKILKPS